MSVLPSGGSKYPIADEIATAQMGMQTYPKGLSVERSA
jgi:hypothetical protein